MNTKQISIVLVIAVLIGIGIWALVKADSKPGKYDTFAQCLEDKGIKFYGAFWCPHCANEKALFGSSKKYLPYVECSTPDSQGQTKVCIDKKIESYPTWIFPEGITLNTETPPVICEKRPGVEGENAVCASHPSDNFKTWIFPDLTVLSDSEPTVTDSEWKFAPESRATGEISLEALALQSSCTLPE